MEHYLLLQSLKIPDKLDITTISGRKNYFPDLHSTNTGDRHAAERQAVNSICQGSASDLVKLAMINVHKRLNQLHQQLRLNQDITSSEASNFKNMTRLLVQIHDELLFEVPIQHISFIKRIIREEMENAVPLSIPMVVNIRTGKTWFEVDNTSKT